MMNGEVIDHHLNALEQSLQALRDQAGALPEAREVLAPALQEVAQALTAVRAAREAEACRLKETPGAQMEHSRQPESAQGRCETFLHHDFEAIPDLLTVIDRDFNIVMSNWPRHDYLTEAENRSYPKCYRIYAHRDSPCEFCQVQEVFASGLPYIREWLDPVAGGFREIYAFPILDEAGHVVLVAEHGRDIQDRKQKEAALAEREELYRFLTEKSLAGVYLIQHKRFVYVNSVVAQIFGYSPEEMVERLIPRDLIHPDDHLLLDEHIRQRLEGEVGEIHHILRGLRRGGGIIYVEFLGRRVDYQGRPAIIGTLLDITERMRAEEALRESEEKYRGLIETTSTGYVIIDPDGKVLDANPEYVRISGHHQLEEILGRSVVEWTSKRDLERNAAKIKRCFKEGFFKNLELNYQGEDGRLIPVEINATVIHTAEGIKILSLVRDISERKEGEEALKTQAQVLASMAEAVHVVDEDGRIVFANPAAYAMFGYPEGELIGQPVSVLNDLPAPENERLSWEIIGHLQREGTWFGEIRNRTKDGTPILTYARVSTLELPGKKLWVAVHEDITARKHLEEATQGYLQFIRTLLETIPTPIFYKDTQGMILGCNKAFAEHAGVPQEEIPGLTVYDLFPGEVARSCDEGDQQALHHPGTQVHMDIPVPAADGSLRQIVCHKAAFLDRSGGVGGVVSISTDITDLQRAKEALKESEERYRLLADNVSDVLWMMDTDYSLTYVSPSVKNMTGYTSDEFISLGLRQIVLPAYHAAFGTSLEKLLAPGMPSSLNYEVEYRRKDNSIGWAEITVTLMRDPSGLIKGLVGMARDFTLRKQTEEALRESETRYRTLFETSPHGIVLMDLQLNITMANQRGLRLFGFNSPEEVLASNGVDFIAPEDQPLVLALIQEMFETGESRTADVRLLKKDGTRVSCLVTASFIRDAAGELQGIIGVAQDITDLKRAEEAVATHLQFMRVLLDAIPNPVFYKDVQGTYLGCNKAFEALMGVSREEIVGKTVYDLHPRELADNYHQMDLALFQTPGNQVYETPLQSADGTLYRVFANKATFLGTDGRVAGLVGNIVDISDLRRAEEAVRESEARLRAIFEHAPVGITMVDSTGRFLQANPAYQEIVGYSAVELQGMTWQQLTHPEDLPLNLQLQEELLAGQHQYYSMEKRYLRKDGKIVWVSMMLSRLQNVQGEPRVVGTVIDVTARKRAEEALRESEQRFRDITEHAVEWVWEVDAQAEFTYSSPVVEHLLGFKPEEVIGKRFYDFFLPDKREELKNAALAVFAAKKPFRHFLNQNLHKNGQIILISTSGVPILDEQGNLRGYRGADIDITAQKQAEEALRESEQRFRLMAETIQDVFWISTPTIGMTKYVSPRYEQVWGRTREAAYQSPLAFLETVHPEDREQVKSAVMACHAQGIPSSIEYRIIKPDGEVRWIHDRGFPVEDEHGRVILFTGVATDITERKTLEQQLLLAQKMEAVGRLAGGVAHDFNNLLMAIMGYGEIMQAKVLKDDPLYDYLEDILKAADRAAALTGQLLTFSRQQILHPQVVDLNRVVLDLSRMLQRLIEEDIELKIITAPKLGAVKADSGQLSQIIMNLVINARDAMPCGGRIIVETAEVDFDKSRPTRSGLAPPGAYVLLEVSDSGVGMNEAVLAHIFEPFFTTKEPGKGTGLGLSTVYGIVKQSGGFIDLDSDPGKGSTFTIYLPRLEAAIKLPKKKISLPTQFGGVETILLVEDEDVLRTLLAKFLRLHGYTVLEAHQGGEALLICEQHQGPIHLMVTDVVMPQMSGRVLADRLTPLRPEMKVLYMSGYTEDEVVQRGVAEQSVAFLQKPFKPIDLVHQVHIMLHPRKRR